MISGILLIWIGAQLNAPAWYFILTSIKIASSVISLILDIIKAFIN